MMGEKEKEIRLIENIYKSVDVDMSLKEKFEELIKESVKAALIESLNGGCFS